MITSKQNKSFKLWKSLKLKKYRDSSGLFLVYGKHIIDKAKEKGAVVQILTTNPSVEGELLDSSLMEELQQAETPFDLIAVCRKTNLVQISKKVLMLDDIQDPENVGALLRSAAAFGFLHVILSHKSADVYNEKTVRASKGSLFDVYIERRPLEDAIIDLKHKGYQIICADAHQKGQSSQTSHVCLILGNEGHGVSEHVQSLVDHFVHIPTQNVESLNVGVAGGILMYEWREK